MGLDENCRANGVKFIDITPDIKSDTFVNEEFKRAVIPNIRRYIEADNLKEAKERARQRLAMIDSSPEKINDKTNSKVKVKSRLRK